MDVILRKSNLLLQDLRGAFTEIISRRSRRFTRLLLRLSPADHADLRRTDARYPERKILYTS